MFFKIGVLKNFVIFHRKTPVLECLFNKVASLQAHSSQRGTKSHLKSQFPPEMTLLKSQQKFQSA